MPDLSVVLIARNQAWNVARLVESVLEQTASCASREIVLVDSASDDGTASQAARYPIRVYRLRAGQRLTAAAGRYVGLNRTAGDLVLFLDGDMELCQGWLEKAVEVCGQRPDVAVVTGLVIDRPLHTARSEAFVVEQAETPVPLVDVKHGGGAALYRRAVLDEVGAFNPHFYSDEEPELCVRIRRRGYRIVELACPAVCHYTEPHEAISTLFARWKRRLYFGPGQILRYHLGSRVFWSYLAERGFGCLPALGLAVGVLSLLLSLLTGQWAWLGLWALALVAVVLLMLYRKRSVHQALYTLVRRALMMAGMWRGFLMRPLAPDAYPALVDEIGREE
ncbi:MAG: glycosyltransferase [Anaerolineae bacterium]|nr:glycosyltransferase [Anaerolineae bacterium]